MEEFIIISLLNLEKEEEKELSSIRQKYTKKKIRN